MVAPSSASSTRARSLPHQKRKRLKISGGLSVRSKCAGGSGCPGNGRQRAFAQHGYLAEISERKTTAASFGGSAAASRYSAIVTEQYFACWPSGAFEPRIESSRPWLFPSLQVCQKVFATARYPAL